MVLETGIHPGELKIWFVLLGNNDRSCSYIRGKGLRTAIISAMQRCTQKSVELSGQTKSKTIKEITLTINLIRNALHDKRLNLNILEFSRFRFNYIKIIPLIPSYYTCVILLETSNFSMQIGNISNSVSNA